MRVLIQVKIESAFKVPDESGKFDCKFNCINNYNLYEMDELAYDQLNGNESWYGHRALHKLFKLEDIDTIKYSDIIGHMVSADSLDSQIGNDLNKVLKENFDIDAILGFRFGFELYNEYLIFNYNSLALNETDASNRLNKLNEDVLRGFKHIFGLNSDEEELKNIKLLANIKVDYETVGYRGRLGEQKAWLFTGVDNRLISDGEIYKNISLLEAVELREQIKTAPARIKSNSV